MIGTIQVVQHAKSGNSLRVQIGGQWYSAKNDSGLTANDVGKSVTFILGDTPFPPGSTNYWINEWQVQDVGNTPSSQAMAQAMEPAEHTAQQRPIPNKDSMIGAFALSKCCIPGSPEQVFENFRLLYHKLESWDSSISF